MLAKERNGLGFESAVREDRLSEIRRWIDVQSPHSLYENDATALAREQKLVEWRSKDVRSNAIQHSNALCPMLKLFERLSIAFCHGASHSSSTSTISDISQSPVLTLAVLIKHKEFQTHPLPHIQSVDITERGSYTLGKTGGKPFGSLPPHARKLQIND